MALNANELFSSATRNPQGRHVWSMIQPKVIAATSGAPILAQMTPISRGASAGDPWVVWADAADLVGFVADKEGIATNATDEVMGNVALSGIIHIDDIVIPAGSTLAALKTALYTLNADNGHDWEIQGLVNVP